MKKHAAIVVLNMRHRGLEISGLLKYCLIFRLQNSKGVEDRKWKCFTSIRV